MRINTDFYSAEQSDLSGVYGIKQFTKTYKELLNSGDLPFNTPWDLSLSPWAMGTKKGHGANYDNDLFNKCWLFPNIDDFDTSENTPDNLLTLDIFDKTQKSVPFWISPATAASNSYAASYYPGRNAYEQTGIPDTVNYKVLNYIATKIDYKRLVFLIQVYISSYGQNNSSLSTSNIGSGAWYALGSITSEQWSDILSGNKCISAVRFVPYYAATEGTPATRTIINSFHFFPLCSFNGLDVNTLGENAGYTSSYIDYTLCSFAGVGNLSGSAPGVSAMVLGHNGQDTYNSFLCKHNVGGNWTLYDSLSAWCSEYFNKTTVKQSVFGTKSTYWKKTALGDNSFQYLYYRQYLDVEQLDSQEKIIDYLCTQCAYLGTFFVLTDNAATSGATDHTNDNMYLGVIESTGITRGRYKKGAEIEGEPQETWSNPWDSSPYNPYSKIYLGDKLVDSIYLGDTLLKAVYCGEQQIL